MKKLIGTKKFYKMLFSVAIPILIQNIVTNFVNLLDNIMVGQIGTEQMSGVSIANQLMFVFHICIFGAISGAGIFGAQFFGNKDQEGVRNALRFKFILCGTITALAVVLFYFFGGQLISLYLHEESSTGDILLTLEYGRQYLFIMLVGMIPFAIVQAYASTLRETGETVLPMKAGIGAVFINLVLNYVLIFGHFGAPRLGVQGAAVATVISRMAECIIVVGWTHRHKERNFFAIGLFCDFKIPKRLTKQILIKGTPLILNEAFWAGGQAVLLQCYSVRGLAVIAGLNISSTISNMFNVFFLAIGSAISIIVGQLLGAGKMEEAKDTAYKLIFFGVSCCVVIGGIMSFAAPFFPRIYNTTDEVRNLAKQFIWCSALCMPMFAFLHSAYFTLRSGGKTGITFLFDSVFAWVVSIPLAYCLTRFSTIAIVPVYLICQSADLIKCFIGFVLLKTGVWIKNIVG